MITWLLPICDIVEALGESGAPSAIPALLDALNNENGPVARDAATALGKLKAKQAIPALTKLLESDEAGVAEAAAEALQKIKG